MDALDEKILNFLHCCRGDGGQPRMGCREVDLARALSWKKLEGRRVVLKRLTALRQQGLVERRGGFVWLTEQEYERRTAEN